MSNPSPPSNNNPPPSGNNNSPPALKPLKGWSYPFPAKNNETVDADTYFKALGAAKSGFYPLGANGLWHGGIHFDDGTGTGLNQTGGMQAIADGEVVAYRLDKDYPTLTYPDNKQAMYSTGYVLVHHKLAIPTLPQASGSGSSNAPASDTSPTPDEVLDFYCLYMHQASWNSYLAGSNMERPKFWEASGGRGFRIAKADRQDAPDDDDDGSTTPVTTPAAARLYGAHVRAAPKLVGHSYVGGDVIGFLKEGSEVKLGTIKGEGKHRWGQITQIVSGDPLSATAGGTAPDASTLQSDGWIYVAEQVSVIEPDLGSLGSTVVLSPPVPIGAGERVGHLGEYQNYSDATPTPPVPHCAMIHMEIFAGDTFPAFLGKSRAFAGQPNLPDSFKTLRIVPKGTALIADAKQPDTNVAANLVMKPVGETDGLWVKVQPNAVGTTGTGTHAHQTLTASGSPVWVKAADVSKTTGVQAWSQFPLQGGPAGQSTALDRVYTTTELGKLGHATDDQGVHWYDVVALGPDNQSIHGWVSEAKFTKVSPFAWPGFEIVDATAITPKDAFQRQMVQQGTLLPGEAQQFKPAAEVVNNSALMQSLDKAMDTDQKGTLDASKLRAALLRPDIAQGISHIIGKYESEWGGDMGRWNDLTSLMKDGTPRWQKELERIQKLQIWADLKSVDGGKFPGATVHHFHPVGLISNFLEKNCNCGCCLGKIFDRVRWHGHYGPQYNGKVPLSDYAGWDGLVSSNQASLDEKKIIVAMSANEGNLDAVQSYDSEILTAGAMQKTINPDGNGELPDQVLRFKAKYPSLYDELFARCGWTVTDDDDGAQMSYQGSETGGKAVTGDDLKTIIRDGFDKSSEKGKKESALMAAIVNAISTSQYQQFQVTDFVDRLRKVVGLKPDGYSGHTIGEYFQSNLGRATALDQHVNRPGHVTRDVGAALKRFFAAHPTVNTDPSTWGDNRASYEASIVDDYGRKRDMNDAVDRFTRLSSKL